MAEGGSLEGGSGSMDEAAQQQPEQGRKQEPGFERGAAVAGGQPPKPVDDPVEAAADKSEGDAMKVCIPPQLQPDSSIQRVPFALRPCGAPTVSLAPDAVRLEAKGKRRVSSWQLAGDQLSRQQC